MVLFYVEIVVVNEKYFWKCNSVYKYNIIIKQHFISSS